jgi:hypothetical protein
MGRFLALLGFGMAAVGCGDPTLMEPRPPAPSYTLAGIVRDLDGVIAGASIRLMDGRTPDRFKQSTDSGFFAFSQVSGPVSLLVTKATYFEVLTQLVVASDRLIAIEMTKDIPLEIPLGVVLHTGITGREPPCDAMGWDASAPCRRFSFTAPQTGTLTVEIVWDGGVELDAVIMTPEGRYGAYSFGTDGRIMVTSPVESDKTYELRVHSYYSAQNFDLKAELAAPSGTSQSHR